MIRLLGWATLVYFFVRLGAWPPVAAGAACGLAVFAVQRWRMSRPYRPRPVPAQPPAPPVVQLPVGPPPGVADLATYRQRREAM